MLKMKQSNKKIDDIHVSFSSDSDSDPIPQKFPPPDFDSLQNIEVKITSDTENTTKPYPQAKLGNEKGSTKSDKGTDQIISKHFTKNKQKASSHLESEDSLQLEAGKDLDKTNRKQVESRGRNKAVSSNDDLFISATACSSKNSKNTPQKTKDDEKKTSYLSTRTNRKGVGSFAEDQTTLSDDDTSNLTNTACPSKKRKIFPKPKIEASEKTSRPSKTSSDDDVPVADIISVSKKHKSTPQKTKVEASGKTAKNKISPSDDASNVSDVTNSSKNRKSIPRKAKAAASKKIDRTNRKEVGSYAEGKESSSDDDTPNLTNIASPSKNQILRKQTKVETLKTSHPSESKTSFGDNASNISDTANPSKNRKNTPRKIKDDSSKKKYRSDKAYRDHVGSSAEDKAVFSDDNVSMLKNTIDPTVEDNVVTSDDDHVSKLKNAANLSKNRKNTSMKANIEVSKKESCPLENFTSFDDKSGTSSTRNRKNELQTTKNDASEKMSSHRSKRANRKEFGSHMEGNAASSNVDTSKKSTTLSAYLQMKQKIMDMESDGKEKSRKKSQNKKTKAGQKRKFKSSDEDLSKSSNKAQDTGNTKTAHYSLGKNEISGDEQLASIPTVDKIQYLEDIEMTDSSLSEEDKGPSSVVQSQKKKREFSCHACDKTFRMTKELSNHTCTGKMKKGFVCEFCNKGFKMRSTYLNHRCIHLAEKRYKCIICREGMTTIGRYLWHMKIEHPELKPFPCQYPPCCKSYLTRKKQGLHHLRSHHKNICPYCDEPFLKKSTYQLHKYREHEMYLQ